LGAAALLGGAAALLGRKLSRGTGARLDEERPTPDR
jgi:hypothetical protein